MKFKGTGIIVILLIITCISSMLTYPKNNQCTPLNQNSIPIPTRDWSSFSEQFRQNRIVLIEDFFEPSFFTRLEQTVLENEKSIFGSRTSTLFNSVRKAGTITSSQIAPAIRDLYYSKQFIDFLRSTTGLPLQNVSCDDKSGMNILVYDKPGDFISWHFDPNHYVGTRLTVLVSITNSSNSGLSSSKLEYKLKGDSNIKSIQMKPNSILIFDGWQIQHRATGIKENEHRVVLSFTYCDVCRETVWGNFIKRFKEMVMGY